MKEFFEVVSLDQALQHAPRFPLLATERVPFAAASGRVLAGDLLSEIELPGFRRSTMDGYAVRASSTFGASEAAPALLEVRGSVTMGTSTDLSVGPGQAARILTGGMLPRGADSVVMIEHTEALDETTIEVTRSVAPAQNVIEADEDLARGQTVLTRGTRLRPQEVGLLAALGQTEVEVYARPVVAILSTGDEVVPAEAAPGPGQIRDINSYTLGAMVEAAGGTALLLGIVPDDMQALSDACRDAIARADMVLVSGGSSVGARDLTLDVIAALPDSEVWIHGVAIKPGKPTILARVGAKPFWGLPGHVASAMVVFHVLVRPFLEHISGVAPQAGRTLPVRARLSRNVASVHGRLDFVRVRLEERDGEVWATPVLGKSGLIRTMVHADGYFAIDTNSEGLDRGVEVRVHRW